MTKKQKEQAEKILTALEKQRFRNFYEGKFVDYIENAENPVEKEEILEDIVELFRL